MTKEEVENRIVAVSPNLFRRFFDGKISNADCEDAGRVFAAYLYDNLKPETLSKIVPESPMDVILLGGHPLRQHGYSSGLVLHLIQWFKDAKEEVEKE